VSGRWIQLEQLLDRVDYIDSLTAAAHPNRQADPAEFVDHVQKLERAAIHRLIELEVDRPHLVRVYGPQ
jgi:Ni,Fe-hydrogenase III large subunit